MANGKRFRGALGGFKKSDVIAYIEQLENEHISEREELEFELREAKEQAETLKESLMSERDSGDAIRIELNETKAKLAQSEEKLTQSEEKLVQNEEKLTQCEEKLAQCEEKLAQCEEKLAQCELIQREYDSIIAEAKQQAQEIKAEAELLLCQAAQKAESVMDEAQIKAVRLEREAESKAEAMLAQTEAQCAEAFEQSEREMAEARGYVEDMKRNMSRYAASIAEQCKAIENAAESIAKPFDAEQKGQARSETSENVKRNLEKLRSIFAKRNENE